MGETQSATRPHLDRGKESETVTQPARCAIYARFSSEKQNPLSIDQQIRKCKEFASPEGLRVLDEWIVTDSAITGATDDRSGLQRLLAAAQMKPRPFDVILVDDTSRLSRKLSDALRIKERLDFVGVRVIFVSQGFDSSAPQSQTLLTVHGLVDGLYLDGLREKTFRGVEQLALQGLHTGGRVFGYRHVPIESSNKQELRTPGDRRRAAANRFEPGADDPENFRAIRRRAFHEADRDRSQPRRNSLAATARRKVAELGAVFRASHFTERALPRHSPLGKNEKDPLTRNREAALSATARKRVAPSRDSRATDRLRGIVEAHA